VGGWPLKQLRTIYSADMVADSEASPSPSAAKPRWVAEALAATAWPLGFVAPEPIPIEALYRVHDRTFVDEVLALARPNGFGSLSASVARSLRFTCGAFLAGALLALDDGLSASLTSGFHHAHYARARGYCTFNGLIASAVHLFDRGLATRVAIVDCDYHYGDGTQSLIQALSLDEQVLHVSFGQRFRRRDQSGDYLAALRDLRGDLVKFGPDIVFFQAGADAHVDDPLGGLLTAEEMRERDRTLFAIGRELGIPVTWNLAGGYQTESDGSIPKVVALHLNTFEEALRVWDLL
jgi:acetoin utilization deacetylase AcuC-like enzyme